VSDPPIQPGVRRPFDHRHTFQEEVHAVVEDIAVGAPPLGDPHAESEVRPGWWGG
jgi:hypothetical protein